jgi:hypothetical protein
VYRLFKELRGSEAQLDKVMVTNTPSLEHALEGFEKVLYFTHDYVYLAPDKGEMLQAAAGICLRYPLVAARKVGAKQFVAVCPIELDHYAEPKITPFIIRQDYETKAMYPTPIHLQEVQPRNNPHPAQPALRRGLLRLPLLGAGDVDGEGDVPEAEGMQ